jgi:cyclopropane-fatty-acyl-phospholipid synthase
MCYHVAMKSKAFLEGLLASADVKINGDRPWDIQVKDERFYDRVLSQGTLGLGESYMDGWWEAEHLDQFFDRVIRARVDKKIPMNLKTLWYFARSVITNQQNRTRATEVAEKHYNLGNDLYTSFLDPYNQYTCGYFAGTDDLNKAQEQKLDLICRKLQLKSTDKLLDIGSGWGGLAKFAAERYGCHVTGITISDEQLKYAQEFTKGLPVEIIKLDYRDLSGSFDKIASVGMIEHVGHKNYRQLFEVVHKCLEEDGLFLLHTIGSVKSVSATEPWIDKYIFPHGHLPSIRQLGKAMDNLFVMEDWHSFGQYYDPTLMAWFKNFHANWGKLKNSNYDERFYRMFKYYLLSCAGAFRARSLQLWQIVMSKHGVLGGYQSIR